MKKLYIPDVVAQVRQLYQPVLDIPFVSVQEQLEAFASHLQQAFEKQNPAATIEISNWHPNWLGKDRPTILEQSFSRTDFELTIAKAYGFDQWEYLMADDPIRFDWAFEKAADAIVSGQYDKLNALLKKHPTLVQQRSPYGHKAGLIHYIGSNGIEIWRQTVPDNLAQIARFLLHAGADPQMSSKIYGHTVGVLPLLESSAHPWDAGIGAEVMAVFH